MVSSHGVIQGHKGIAAVDSKHQVIVGAEAEAEKSESQSLIPMVEKVEETFKELGDSHIYKDVQLTADSGFFSEKRHRKPTDRHKGKKKLYTRKYFVPDEFKYDEVTQKLICPAGKYLYVKNRNFKTQKGSYGTAYMARVTDCRSCGMREKCLQNPGTVARQVTKFVGREEYKNKTFSQWMRDRIDTVKGRYLHSRRMGIAEPPFANIRDKIGLNKFTMRGSTKTNAQWKMYAMVHKLFKIYRYGGGLAPGIT